MADPAQFGHDRLGHLLSDRLLKVPKFQRRYSWETEHVSDFWQDIERARAVGDAYFMGTIVLASDADDPARELIIDGQQRITTTALLFIAIRNRLRALDQDRAAQSVESNYLSDYSLDAEEDIPKLSVSADDVSPFAQLLDGEAKDTPENLPLSRAYQQLLGYVNKLGENKEDYRKLIDLVKYLEERVQVLIAVASSLQEAYVIFETLNDRGADLTTADLLKNYLFSQAGSSEIDHAQRTWTRISGRFDKPDSLVKFIRYEYMSRRGRVTNRGLYKALQADIGEGGNAVRSYLDRLETTLSRYIALREPDDASWSSQAVEVKDSLLAFRRFGFESSMPLLLAAFSVWEHTQATRFVETVAAWSVRALMAGTLGGGVAEEAFCNAAVAVTKRSVTNPEGLRPLMASLVPDDSTFRESFLRYGAITTTRAKYLLARLERQHLLEEGNTPDGMPDWSSKAVSVEHIIARSTKESSFVSRQDFERFTLMKEQLQNMTLLERTLNGDLEDKPFTDKASTYRESSFALTKRLGEIPSFDFDAADSRLNELADLAVLAWPF